jgi:hypothetical protein
MQLSSLTFDNSSHAAEIRRKGWKCRVAQDRHWNGVSGKVELVPNSYHVGYWSPDGRICVFRTRVDPLVAQCLMYEFFRLVKAWTPEMKVAA